MSHVTTTHLVSADWLKTHLHDSGIRVFDCTTHMVAQPVGASKIISGRPAYEQGHIPGAIHLDMVQDLSDPSGTYPYTMLQPQEFEQLARRIGLQKEDHVVLYGTSAITTITRAWLVFYVMGHTQVSILDGGLKAWQSVHGEITSSIPSIVPSQYTVDAPRLNHIADLSRVKEMTRKNPACLVNALSREQYEGTGGAHYGRPGRIPGSRHLAARDLVDPENGLFRSQTKLLRMIQEAGLEPHMPVIHYCGGGIAASTTAFVLAMLGWNDWALYDNSLLEWSTQSDTPMEIGQSRG
ncbi:sulfurtransferase [Orrella marina]|uniref:Rhodanese domain-containing protein n=1 Tax=Orrella marina TaxID=2163011 RepID=A0A2R4XIU7_9BURK|nr:sulfurtransferase [Orrella marina]AWB33731.1 hypothetical protein DBV39_08470 [Orrella marina]